MPPGLRGGGGSPGWLLERWRRRQDLGATGRAERPSLLPLLAPLSARRARSGSGAGASSSREAGASATRDAAGRSRVMALGVSRRHGKGRRAAWCSAKSAGALWDRSWPKDRNRTAPNYCRRGLTLGQKSPPIFRSCKDCFSEHATVLGHCDCPWSLSHYEGIQHVQHTGSSIDFFLE